MENKNRLQIVGRAYRAVLETTDTDDPAFQELFEQEVVEQTQRARISEQADFSIYVPDSSTKKLSEFEEDDKEEDNDI